MFGGKPVYEPAMCEQVIKRAKEGWSVTRQCAELGIHRSTWYDWKKAHSDFKEAATMAEVYAQAHWEDVGYQIMTGQKKDANATAFIFQMKNRFRDPEHGYLDKQHHAVEAKVEKITREVVDPKAE